MNCWNFYNENDTKRDIILMIFNGCNEKSFVLEFARYRYRAGVHIKSALGQSVRPRARA